MSVTINNKYRVKYITSSSEWPPCEREDIISASSLEEALFKVKRDCFNNYMTCEFISIIKEELK